MYDINNLSLITGLTDRTLRNYLSMGILKGEKQEGKWLFTEEQVDEFISHPAVTPSLKAKRNALIYDFLAENSSNNRLITVLQINADKNRAGEISEFFCNKMKSMKNADFSFTYEKGRAQVILKGDEDEVSKAMTEYYSL